MRDYVRDPLGRFASTPGGGSSRKTVQAKRSVSRAADANRATRAKKAANPATDRRLNRESEQLGNRAIAARPTKRRAKPLTGEAVYATRGTANTPWPGQPRRNYDSGSQRSDTRMGRDAARRDRKRQNQVLSADTGKAGQAAKAPKPKPLKAANVAYRKSESPRLGGTGKPNSTKRVRVNINATTKNRKVHNAHTVARKAEANWSDSVRSPSGGKASLADIRRAGNAQLRNNKTTTPQGFFW